MFPRSLTPTDWDLLVERIRDQECVPFLGRGVNPYSLSELANGWAKECGIEETQSGNFARIAQYMAMRHFPLRPKQLLCKYLKSLPRPVYTAPSQPHAYLASLPLKLYVTTNYDDYMSAALSSRAPKDKKPELSMATWDESLRPLAPQLDSKFQPDVATPLVYHLHGHFNHPESLVLTEDDYLDFLGSLFRENQTDITTQVIDGRVRRILTRSSWLLLGYQLEDWDLRVLLRFLDGIRKVNKDMHVSVQLYPLNKQGDADHLQNAIKYLDKYFSDRQVRVFWGGVTDFVNELKKKL